MLPSISQLLYSNSFSIAFECFVPFSATFSNLPCVFTESKGIMKVNIWKSVFLCVQYRKPCYFNLLTTHNLLPTDPLRNRTPKLYQVTYIKRVTFSSGFVHNINESRTCSHRLGIRTLS